MTPDHMGFFFLYKVKILSQNFEHTKINLLSLPNYNFQLKFVPYPFKMTTVLTTCYLLLNTCY